MERVYYYAAHVAGIAMLGMTRGFLIQMLTMALMTLLCLHHKGKLLPGF